jgi:uncharacterized protein (UPF0332 family)
MNEYELKKLLEDKKYLESKILLYTKKKIITKTTSKSEIKGHMEKARHNLSFTKEISSKYADWKLIVCYYTIYHAALALIATKDYTSKNHDASLCMIIKHFYNSGLSKKDIELLNMLDAQDLFFYVESKQKREDAQYSTKINFENKDIELIRLKTILFVNKTETIIKSNRKI